MIPQISYTIEMPAMLSPSGSPRSRMNRIHAAAVKEALKSTLKTHHRTRIKEHFKQSAKTRYGHYTRDFKTLALKRRHWGNLPDLVKSGEMRRKIKTQRPRLRASGTVFRGFVSVLMQLKFPESFRSSPGARGVTRAKMAEEISRWTSDEERAAAQEFIRRYAQIINQKIRSKRWRKTIAPQLRKVGITP